MNNSNQPADEATPRTTRISVEDALRTPDEAIVQHTLLGWSLQFLGSDIALVISQNDAVRIIQAQQITQPARVPRLIALLK